MAINKKNNENKENKESKFIAESVEVLRVAELEPSKNVDVLIACDLKINGVKIYGCFYLEGKKEGKEWSMIKLPETKGKNGNYYSVVWFPISKELTKKIADLIEKML